MHREQCVCADIPHLALATRVILVMHRRELVKTTATGPLALLALPNSELLIHGNRADPVDLRRLCDPTQNALLLFPDDEAPELTSAWLRSEMSDPNRPITLVVPDGSWRQAHRMSRRLPGMEKVQRVRLPAGLPTAYRLRTSKRPQGLATFEAIARALGIIESAEVQVRLETLFQMMVERTLSTRSCGPAEPCSAPVVP
jgi:DTW domain-containing protein